MRLYLEVGRRSFQRHLQYRAATLAGIFTNAVFGVMLASVFLGFYRDGGEASVAGFTAAEAVTYVWVSQALLAPVQIFGTWEIAATVKSGDVVNDLMKPFSFQGYWLGRDLGRAACHALIRSLPTLGLGALLFDLALPTAPNRWLAFALCVALAVVVSFGWRFLVNLATFWLLDEKGLQTASLLMVTFFSGMLLPLTFFPPWLRTVAEALPFRALVMVPNEVLQGQRDLAGALAIQVAWAAVLVLLGQAVLALAVRKVVVQGG